MISLPIKTVKNILYKILSSDGYSFKDLNIKFPQPLNMVFGNIDENTISLKFVDALPKISWKRFITISALIQEIVLGDEGGVIRIKYFPDLKFTYSKTSNSESNFLSFDFSSIASEINNKYDDEERRKIANLCLQYASDWVRMCYAAGVDSVELSNNKALQNDCFEFVKSNVIQHCRDNYKSVVISFLVIYVILPIILKWVIERIFANINN